MKIYIFIVLTLSGCSTTQNTYFSNIKDMIILERGQEGENASKLCGMFDLTTPEALEYFRHSIKISKNNAHHLYDYYSCWVKGEFKNNDQVCQWHIDIGGLADVYCGAQEYNLYCNNCENFLLDKIP